MPFTAAPGILKAEFLYHWSGGKVMANVLHLARVSGSLATWSISELDGTMAESIFNAWSSGSNNVMSSRAGTLTLDKVVLTDLSVLTGLQETSGHAPVTGAASGSALPSPDCVLIKLSTPTRSRSGRGRVYLPAITVNDVDAFGALVPSYTATVKAGWDLFVTGAAAAHVPVEPVILNRAAGTAIAVTSRDVETIARSQRRRELDH